jgi:hypothetical protein
MCQSRVCVYPQRCTSGMLCCNPGEQACGGTCCNQACLQGRCLPFGSSICGANVCSAGKMCLNNQVRQVSVEILLALSSWHKVLLIRLIFRSHFGKAGSNLHGKVSSVHRTVQHVVLQHVV